MMVGYARVERKQKKWRVDGQPTSAMRFLLVLDRVRRFQAPKAAIETTTNVSSFPRCDSRRSGEDIEKVAADNLSRASRMIAPNAQGHWQRSTADRGLADLL